MPSRTTPAVHRGPLDGSTAAEVRALARAAADHDGVAPLSEQPLLQLESGPDAVHLLTRAEDGSLAAYAQLDLGAPELAGAELVVTPAARRSGLGRGLLAAARQVAANDPAAPRSLRVWAHGDLPAARALAADAGMSVVRELWQMSLDLREHPVAARPTLPNGVEVRAFVPGQDEEAWRRVNARAFAHHPEQGRLTREDLAARMAEPWFDPAGFLLAERDGVLLASVWTKVHDGADGTDAAGEIYVVGVDPDAQGLGLGGALTGLGVAHLASRGLPRVILYTDADNTVAVRTYTRAGFVRSAVDVQFG
ncbi:mycothiol synthase [Cellulomonas aerilata]|uniref:Mycothiol acetyltransferase n=1 Tax=Cellulomonas aerilata TaxID=515326 RepID=A0A512DFJ7_9CELL|nr:mycothiol synthase [Cellulomonas aerilata]GEO34990.1 mycothiol acetyltransferase [Cellulomonas aerilata]